MPKKRRIGDPVLFITPSSNYAGEEADARSFVFSLQGGGCEVLNIDTAKASDLWRMGLTMQTSKMLLSEIKSVLDTIGETYE
ncbi:MAG: hypothetical protein KAJ73_00520 [Zetaproteobacteria bacterium]|nr:hypothetical protein [Zetaproteobacteria bacterium]